MQYIEYLFDLLHVYFLNIMILKTFNSNLTGLLLVMKVLYVMKVEEIIVLDCQQ